MQKLNSWIACFFISITTPAIALATTNNDHKNANYESIYTSDSSWSSIISTDKEFSEKSIISSAESSHDSFQEKSEYQSKWEKQRNQIEGKDSLTDVKHSIGNFDTWVTGQNNHNENETFHEHLSLEKEFEHGEHEMVDKHFTQPVPELETNLMFLIGVISIATIKRRQYSKNI